MQGPLDHLVMDGGQGRSAFTMKPDMNLKWGDVRFILDVKWKHINANGNDPKHDINQADMYQLFAYGKKYGCRHVALVYPKTERFQKPLRYTFDEELALSCFPFDVTDPQRSVGEIIDSVGA